MSEIIEDSQGLGGRGQWEKLATADGGKKGQFVLTDFDEAAALSEGIYETYQEKNLRYSQLAPLEMFKEKNTASNLPAQIDLLAEKGDEYHFLFVAKGGGSANKAYLYQSTPAVLNRRRVISSFSVCSSQFGSRSYDGVSV